MDAHVDVQLAVHGQNSTKLLISHHRFTTHHKPHSSDTHTHTENTDTQTQTQPQTQTHSHTHIHCARIPTLTITPHHVISPFSQHDLLECTLDHTKTPRSPQRPSATLGPPLPRERHTPRTHTWHTNWAHQRVTPFKNFSSDFFLLPLNMVMFRASSTRRHRPTNRRSWFNPTLFCQSVRLAKLELEGWTSHNRQMSQWRRPPIYVRTCTTVVTASTHCKK